MPARNLVADRDGTVYYVHNWKGVFVSADQGASWEQASTGTMPTAWRTRVTLDVNPAWAGDLWLAAATDAPSQTPIPMFRSPDGGKSWGAVPSTSVANFFSDRKSTRLHSCH